MRPPSAPRAAAGRALAAVPGLAVILALATLRARAQVASLDFMPFNGHFQNFNMSARLLGGQVPFVDFPVYLGAGPLLAPFPLFAALGGDFGASGAAFEFVSVLLLGISLGLGFRLAGLPALAAWLLAPVAASQFPSLSEAHVSALGIRSFLPFAAGALLLALCRARRVGGRPVALFACAGAAAGLFPLWSNDYGAPTLAALAAVMAAARFPGARRLPACLAAFAAAAAASLLLGATALTAGHPGAWFALLGEVAGTQFWYFNPNVDAKVFGPGDIPLTPAVSASLAASAALVAGWAARRRRDARWAALAVVLLGTVGGVAASGLGGTFEHRYVVPLHRAGLISAAGLAALLAAPLARALGRPAPEFSRAARALAATLAALVSALAAASLFDSGRLAMDPWPSPVAARRADELGANLWGDDYLPAVEMGRGLRRAYDAAALPPDRRLLSAYSTVLTAVSGSRQAVPDYIIHALGREASARFVAALDDGYANVEAPDPARSRFGAWSSRTSWPFYRKLFLEWRPVASTGYSVLWERRPEPLAAGGAEACSASLAPDGATWRISVGAEGAPEPTWVEVELRVEASLRPSGIPLVGSRGVALLGAPWTALEARVPDPLEADIETVAARRWTARLETGIMAFPLVLAPGRQATVGLRALPAGRASIAVTSCSATRIAPVSETVPR